MRLSHNLSLLKDLGADPEARRVRRAIDRVRKHITWYQLDGRPYFDGETEPCINGRILGTGAYFGEPSKRLPDRLLREQLEDGEWNCQAPKSRCASFHTTICVLEGLLEYESASGRSDAVTRTYSYETARLTLAGISGDGDTPSKYRYEMNRRNADNKSELPTDPQELRRCLP